MQLIRSARLLALLPFVFLGACANPRQFPDRPSVEQGVQARFFVDPARGDDTSRGTSADAPFRTLERARDAARKVPRPLIGDIEIILREGDYLLERPLALTALDGGDAGHRVRYQAAPGENPRLSGARRIEGWTLHDRGRNIYRANLRAPLETRQLFVNGRRAVRARSIAGIEDIKRHESGYTLPADAAIGTWKNPADIEFVYRHIWTNPRAGVASIDQKTDFVRITMDQPGFDNGRNKGMTSIGDPWYVENAYELLDEPGEWYLDRTGAVGSASYTLYYKPYDWENLRKASVVAPVLEQLVTVDGESVDAQVRNLTFHGISFLYTTWLRPSSPYGVPDAQNNVMRENFGKFKSARGDQESIIDGAALRLRYASGIHVTGSRFINLGGIGVCFATAGAQDNLVEGNTFFNIAANAIQIGDYVGWETPGTENNAFPADPKFHVARNKILNNYINRAAVEYRSAIPIGISFPRDSVVAHNEIYNSPYSGIHFGWAWDRVSKTSMGNNLIEWNRIQNSMVELADGGAFYNLGPSDPDHPFTVLRNNWARQTRWGQGFYFDESTSRHEAYDNVIEAIGDANIKFNGKTNRETRVTNLYSNKDRNIVSPGLDLVAAELSIEKVRPMDAPEHSAEVARIKAGAGLQPAHAGARMLPIDAVIHELEEAEVANSAYVTNGMGYKPVTFGYSGMGFVSNLARRAGGAISVTARLSRATDYQIRFRYCSPEKDISGISVSANGQESLLPVLLSTRAPNTWGVVTHTVRLKEGVNTLVFTATQAHEGAFYADRIELVPLR
ncbi:MAG: right-handed parallel beta-helix repeat-containing protein [Opitutaceae bacterium]|jgi:hypothetical protein|nr:right-handed parallel beta-helix repeat-containing protein [Opitutaceae bacterium]